MKFYKLSRENSKLLPGNIIAEERKMRQAATNFALLT